MGRIPHPVSVTDQLSLWDKEALMIVFYLLFLFNSGKMLSYENLTKPVLMYSFLPGVPMEHIPHFISVTDQLSLWDKEVLMIVFTCHFLFNGGKILSYKSLTIPVLMYSFLPGVPMGRIPYPVSVTDQLSLWDKEAFMIVFYLQIDRLFNLF